MPILLVLWTSQPLIALAPSIPSQQELTIIQGNSVQARNPPSLPETKSYGVILATRSGIKELAREKYQQFLREELLRIGETDKDFLIMKEVIFCECDWEHYYLTGEVKVSKGNVGFGQINIVAHYKTYTKMGLDIYDPYDNLRFAAFLYQRDGLNPWLPYSGHCFLPRIQNI